MSLDEIISMSKLISDQSDTYKHNDYQSMIAASTLSSSKSFNVVVVPTGSGKTWIQGLIAKYHCDKGLGVTIIEPNDDLQQQTADMLIPLDYGISVISIDHYYQYGSQDQIVIIDEYDAVMHHKPYAIFNEMINGIWSLKDKTVYAFSATSSIAIERFVFKTIGQINKLVFKSEYEYQHGTSPLQEGHVVVCDSYPQVLAQVKDQILKSYDHKPLIIIYDEDQLDSILEILKIEKLRFFQGTDPDTLKKIRGMNDGILMIDKGSSRGIDVRFNRDAVVIIIAKVDSYSQYLQMIGRSSRTRQVCEATLYSSSGQKAHTIFQQMKTNDINPMLELENLVPILINRQDDKNLVKVIIKQQESGKMIRSLKELEKLVGAKEFSRLIKQQKK